MPATKSYSGSHAEFKFDIFSLSPGGRGDQPPSPAAPPNSSERFATATGKKVEAQRTQRVTPKFNEGGRPHRS
ncbi:MAG: hypothetical protein ABSA97_03725 [Verrucomicrobiia bacterium]